MATSIPLDMTRRDVRANVELLQRLQSPEAQAYRKKNNLAPVSYVDYTPVVSGGGGARTSSQAQDPSGRNGSSYSQAQDPNPLQAAANAGMNADPAGAPRTRGGGRSSLEYSNASGGGGGGSSKAQSGDLAARKQDLAERKQNFEEQKYKDKQAASQSTQEAQKSSSQRRPKEEAKKPTNASPKGPKKGGGGGGGGKGSKSPEQQAREQGRKDRAMDKENRRTANTKDRRDAEAAAKAAGYNNVRAQKDAEANEAAFSKYRANKQNNGARGKNNSPGGDPSYGPGTGGSANQAGNQAAANAMYGPSMDMNNLIGKSKNQGANKGEKGSNKGTIDANGNPTGDGWQDPDDKKTAGGPKMTHAYGNKYAKMVKARGDLG